MAKLVSLCEACVDVVSTLEEEKILPVVVERAKQLTQAEKVVTFLVDQKSGKFEANKKTLAVRGRRDQHAESWWRRSLENLTQESVKKGDLSLVSEECHCAKALTKNNQETVLVGIPFSIKGRNIGIISALNSFPHKFTSSEITILSILALQAATALENAKLFRELQVRGDELQLLQELERLSHKLLEIQEEERRRISRELHDDTAQALTNVIIRLEMSKELIPSAFAKVRKTLEELKQTANSALDGVHRLAFDLRPSMLEDIGLVPTLKWYTKNRVEKAGVRTVFEATGQTEQPLPKPIQTAILRIAQEGLNNVVKHAQASEVRLTLDFMPDTQITITIKDDGKGFDPDKALRNKEEAIGLVGMRERTDFFGGSFKVESKPGLGSKITAIIPLKRPRGLNA